MKIVMIFEVSDGYTYSFSYTVLIEYISIADAEVDFYLVCKKANFSNS